MKLPEVEPLSLYHLVHNRLQLLSLRISTERISQYLAFVLTVLNSTYNTLSQFACAQAYMKVYASTKLHFNRKMKLWPNKILILCLQRKPLGSSNLCRKLMWSHMATTADIIRVWCFHSALCSGSGTVGCENVVLSVDTKKLSSRLHQNKSSNRLHSTIPSWTGRMTDTLRRNRKRLTQQNSSFFLRWHISALP